MLRRNLIPVALVKRFELCLVDCVWTKCRLLGLSLLLMGPLTSSGQFFDETWNNTGTGDWFNASNWTTGTEDGVPTAAETALVNNGGTAQIGANNAVASSLTIGLPMPEASPAPVGIQWKYRREVFSGLVSRPAAA